MHVLKLPSPGCRPHNLHLPSLSACPSMGGSSLRVDRFPAKPCEELFRIGFQRGSTTHWNHLLIAAEGAPPRGHDKNFLSE